MDDRSYALTIQCPRCGKTYPPQGGSGPFMTCTKCGLSISTTAPPPEARAKKPTAQPDVDPPLLVAHGDFHAGSMGYRAEPYPMAGSGSCSVYPRYLTVSAFRPRSAWVRTARLFGGFAAAIALGLGLGALNLPDKLAVGLPFILFIAVAMAPVGASSQIARFRIPLENIASVRLVSRGMRGIATGTVLIVIKDTAPSGEIRFVTEEPERLVAALEKLRAR